ncbi:amidase family protein [Conexibacter stalactiti]|uniref:Amidase family protein n=1 Tax=Conexibacter stalactiti TaxID=1940611 RepID=A0ABU4HTW7_9ACTN|nr:amidase family protein [Conexibacter stalactiti]MDW5596122.1 amidase family protein [Conexibacter stalactiti]MEC5036764.1 amidase family protein [Conexibacter stalactiti]
MLSAREQARAVRAGEISAVELMDDHYDRIDAAEPQLGAIVNALPRERALELAREADRTTAAARAAGGGAAGRAAGAAGEPLGLLHGLPIAVKDVMDVAGFPTTAGSLVHADRIATRDSLLAERLRAAGALIIGKTNTPEHGLGTLTFNKLFPPTRNPYDLTRHAGGSSGGAAAAVAAGLLPLADGSDSGGSLRYPAAFCNVVGLRPSPGRIPSSRPDDGWSPHGVLGPIARDVGDAGLLLAALAGRDDRTPIALDDDPLAFAALAPSDLRGVKVAWSRTVDGLPIDPEVTAALEQSRALLVEAGALVEEVEPDLSGADEAWETIEMLGFLAFCGADVDAHRELMRDDIVRNVEQGRALSAQQIVDAQAARTAVYRRTTRLLERYDLLATPTAPVVAPPIEVEWVSEIAGERFDRYFLWQRCASRIVATAHPALSLPGGFTPAGLPVGLQLVGRHRGELDLLRHAAALEAASGFAQRRPPMLAAGR